MKWTFLASAVCPKCPQVTFSGEIPPGSMSHLDSLISRLERLLRECVAARVALEHKHAYELLSSHGELIAECTGKLLHDTSTRSELPSVGDWVVARLRPGESHACPN